MTHDVELLTKWVHTCLAVAAFCSTSFPVLYAFSPWYSTLLGRFLMLQAVSFALAIDMTLLFQFWVPSDILVLFWINAIVFTLIAGATFGLTVMLWRTNHVKNDLRGFKRRKTDV